MFYMGTVYPQMLNDKIKIQVVLLDRVVLTGIQIFKSFTFPHANVNIIEVIDRISY